MKWMLVFIIVKGGVPHSFMQGTYEKMDQCFYEREILSDKVGRGNGWFGPNKQALCMQVKE